MVDESIQLSDISPLDRQRIRVAIAEAQAQGRIPTEGLSIFSRPVVLPTPVYRHADDQPQTTQKK